jgi:hypothetical protein
MSKCFQELQQHEQEGTGRRPREHMDQMSFPEEVSAYFTGCTWLCQHTLGFTVIIEKIKLSSALLTRLEESESSILFAAILAHLMLKVIAAYVICYYLQVSFLL